MNRERDEVFRSYGILDLSYQQRGRDLDTIHTVQCTHINKQSWARRDNVTMISEKLLVIATFLVYIRCAFYI